MRFGGILLWGIALFEAGCASTAPARSTHLEAPAPARSPSPPGKVVVVAPGDTLLRLATAAGISVEELMEVNGLHSPDDIEVGQRLFLPLGPTPVAPEEESSRAIAHVRGEKARAPRPPAGRSDRGAEQGLPEATTERGLRWPVEGTILRDFSPSLPATGKRRGREAYEGLLIAAPAGTLVRSAASGVVAFAGSQGTTNGFFAVVEHGGGLVTVYAHMKSIDVKVGQTVEAGEVLGEIGTTGLTGASPRVQFQVRRDHVAIDPLTLLAP
jgi:murein DD-endopeptidase MepM/ murein hydrolase activator NlpD